MWISSHTGRPGNSGFTLVELLVAIALSSVLLAALYATFFSVLNAGRASGDSLDRFIEAGRLLDRMTSDIHAAYYAPENVLTVFSGERRGMGASVSMTPFTRPPVKKGRPASDLLGVRYFSEEAGEGVRVYREVWNPYINERVKTEVLSGVEAFEISYYNGTAWAKAWDAGLENSLPSAVKVTVRLRGGEELSALSRTMLKAVER